MPRVTLEWKIKKALFDAYPPPRRIIWLMNTATFDLYFGPYQQGDDIDGEVYPGFANALDEIADWHDENVPSEVWYDNDSGEVFERPQEPYEEDGEWFEPLWEEIFHVGDTRRAMFGKLAEYM